MIVLTPTQAKVFGEVLYAPHQLYVPIEIKGTLFVLPEEAENEVIKKGIYGYDKRTVLESEWIKEI